MKIACACLAIILFQVAHAQSGMVFSHYNAIDGLSNNSVRIVYQDHQGFIWIGTDDGLNRFDGYRFDKFEYDDKDAGSLSSNRISAIAEDNAGNLWIGTYDGLNRYDRITGKFQRYYHDSTRVNSLLHNRISSLLIDTGNNLWIGTYLGLQQYNISRSQFTSFSSYITMEEGRKEKEISCLLDDGKGNLWMGVMWGGLKKLNKKTGEFTDFWADPGKRGSIKNNNVLSLCMDDEDCLWIGNYAGGLSRLSLATEEFLSFENPENNATVWSISKDNQGKIWYTRTGVGIITRNDNRVQLLNFSNNNPGSISSGYHYYVYCDQSGIMWLGSSDGLSMYNKNNRKFASYLRLVDKSRRYYITSFFKDPENNNLWLGTFRDGLFRYNEKNQRYDQFNCGYRHDLSSPENYLTCIFSDNKGQLWVGTDNGIAIMDKESGKLRKSLYHDAHNPNLNNNIRGYRGFMFLENDSVRIIDVTTGNEYTFPSSGAGALPGRIIYSVVRENDSIVWIGASEGIARYNTGSGSLTVKSRAGNAYIQGESVFSLFIGRTNVLWAGTSRGLYRYNPQQGIFDRTSAVVINQSVNEISEDEQDNLWLLTEKGLAKYHPATGKISHYDEQDGIRTHNALYKAYDGTIYCNRPNEGYFAFHPAGITDNLEKPKVYLTRFLLFNKEVAVASEKFESPLKATLNSTSEIKLKHHQNMITFEFTAINFTQPEKNTFTYMLEGFDKDWYTTDAQHRTATYTNLNQGVYTFRVRAANGDGILSDQDAEIQIRILPPPWKTWWAYIIYTGLIAGALLLFRYNLIQKEKQKTNIRNAVLEYEHQLKTDEMKMRFFANISHEFRTPLTLILAPLNSILQKALQQSDQETLEHAGLIKRNASRLSVLINQLLDLQKLEAKKLKPEICEGDIVLFVKSTFEKFTPLAVRNNVSYHFTCATQEISAWYDPDKTEKIISNLLSNAFKFTHNVVKVLLSADTTHFTVSVEDNGSGIPVEFHEKIFDRFYHVDGSPGKVQEGTGLGLSLVKEMTDLLNGTISVESEKGKGTVFSVKLPRTKELFNNYAERKDDESHAGVTFDIPPVDSASPGAGKTANDAPLILVVEDNEDLRNYLRMVLSARYHISESGNGKDGLCKAREMIPDLIISDIVMPEMDGVEMTRLLKDDDRTSHIPVILLTSLVSTDNKIRGFETGADDYITKPFNEDILLHRISNLIKLRKQLQRYYSSKYGLKGSANQLTAETENADEKFLRKMSEIAEKNIHDTGFGNERLAAALGMSVAVLYRKTNALMNCTPADFIKNMRVNHAVHLLMTGNLSVSEIAGMVGFDDPHYFGKWFKKNYGKAPSEVKRKV